MLRRRICHLFSGGDAVDLLLQDVLHLIKSVRREGVGAEKNDVRGARFDDVFVRSNDNVRPVSSFGLDVVVHGSTDLGSSSHDAYDVNALLGKKHVGHSAAHSTESPNDNFYVLHSDSPFLMRKL